MDYIAEKDESGSPILLPGEETYLWQDKINFSEKRGELQKGIGMITTYCLYWYCPTDSSKPALRIPLVNLGEVSTSGGWIASEKAYIKIEGAELHPDFIKHYYHEILKLPIPPVPMYPSEFRLEFADGGRDKFLAKLKEAQKYKYWEQFGKKKEQMNIMSGGLKGISGIKKSMEEARMKMQNQIATSFTGMDALRESARGLVAIAEKIRTKLSQTEGGGVSKEMQELQEVMYDIGIGTPVTKEAAGKEYFSQLAKQFAGFVKEAVDKSGGIITLLDAYCLYNRARGTDSVSPEDIFIAAGMFNKLGINIKLRQLKSKVYIFESESFNEKVQIEKILALIKEKGSLSSDQLANYLNVNHYIVKESIAKAEEAGSICRDDSIQGLLFCINPFKAIKV